MVLPAIKGSPESILIVMVTMILFDFYGVFMPDPYDHWLRSNGHTRTGIFADIAARLDRGEITKQDFFGALSQEIGQTVTDYDTPGAKPAIDREVVSLARQLSKHYTLGLLSNASPELRGKLRALKVDGLFDHIFISSEMKMSKPQPEIYKAVLATVMLRPDQIIFIDDKDANITAARQLGIPSLKFTDSVGLQDRLNAAGVSI